MTDFRSKTKLEITLADLDGLERRAKDAEVRVRELEQQLDEALLSDPAGTIKDLHAAFYEAMKVVQFAVGNLDPTTVRGWPYEALGAIADALEKIPVMDIHIKEMSPDLRAFAKNAAGYEAWRRERDKDRPVVAASPSDFGPKTPEAEFVHQAKQQGVVAQKSDD